MKIGDTTQLTETIITNYSLNFPIAESDMKLLHNFLLTIARVTPNFNNYVNIRFNEQSTSEPKKPATIVVSYRNHI